MRTRLFRFIMVLAAVVAFVVTATFATPVTVSAKAKKRYRIAVVVPNGVDPYFFSKWYGSVEEAKEQGVEVTMFDAGGYEFLPKQVAHVDDIIAAKYDGMIITPTSTKGMASAVEKAVAAGIKVVVDNIDVDTNKVANRVMKNSYELGLLIGAAMAEAIGYKGKVMMLPGPSGIEMVTSMAKGFEDYLGHYPKIQIVAKEFTKSNVQVAYQTAEDLLKKHPDVAGIYPWATLIARGTVDAVKAGGFKPGQIKIVTHNLVVGVEKDIRDGWVYGAVLAEQIAMAREAVRNVIDLIEGRQPQGVPYRGGTLAYIKNFMAYKHNLELLDRSGIEAPKEW
ncbi:MAG: substrate-binding domain-containing protein, partial [bacterium]|nr:substrate-binding domain-containing protein [bacterium]